MSSTKASRRQFLKLAAVAGGATVLAACGGTPTATPVPPTATKPPAPPTATTAPAPAAATATTAPSAPTATKPPAAATAAPTTAAAPTPTLPPASQVGAQYIGKLEGYEVLPDAPMPSKFGEAPTLATLVAAGKLPTVDKRLPTEPCITKPVKEVGKYGGTWRRGFTGAADGENGNRMSAVDKWIFWDYTGTKIIPSVAKAWKVSEDGKKTTIVLRKGAKWSDGSPYTADDCMFWFEDVYGNKDLTPTPLGEMSVAGKPGKMVKIDELTIEFQFEAPYYLFELVLAGDMGPGRGQATGQFQTYTGGGYSPKAYLSKFLPKYTDQAKLDADAKAAGFTDWKSRFIVLKDWERNADLPVMTPWKLVAGTDITKPQWVVERNPFYWEIDTNGNQLPYIDKVQWTLGENTEVINLRAIAGELDEQERHLDINKLPVFIENQQKGNYTLHLDPAVNGGDANMVFNFSYNADPEIVKWFANRDFRRALSMGIDRNQLNESFWLGLGTPGSPVPDEAMPENPGKEWRTKWHTLDVAQANSLLDKIGLDKKDASGMRLRTDGKGVLRIEIQTTNNFMNYSKPSEMVAQQWKKIGITLDVKDLDRATWTANRDANQQQLSMWSNGGTELIYLYPVHAIPVQFGSQYGPEIAKWYESNGAQGKAPTDPDLKKAIELYTSAKTLKLEERNKIAQEIWKLYVDNVFGIGLCGVSVAFLGVRIAKNNLGNVPARHINAQHMRTPCSSRPSMLFYKS